MRMGKAIHCSAYLTFQRIADLVLKIELPAEWRRDVLRNLDLMGITAASLFPGASGVAQEAGRIVQDDFRHVRSEVEGH